MPKLICKTFDVEHNTFPVAIMKQHRKLTQNTDNGGRFEQYICCHDINPHTTGANFYKNSNSMCSKKAHFVHSIFRVLRVTKCVDFTT